MGLDYWKDVRPPSSGTPSTSYLGSVLPADGRPLALQHQGRTASPWEVAFQPRRLPHPAGCETRGLPEKRPRTLHPDRVLRIPMAESATSIRSLNLATAAAVVLYEALRQTGFP